MLHSISKFTILGLTAVSLLCQCRGLHVDEERTPIIKLAPPTSSSALYKETYRKIIQARKLEKRHPRTALSIYLSAAQDTYASNQDHTLTLYNHAVGQSIDLLTAQATAGTPVRQVTLPDGRTITIDTSAHDVHGYGISSYDDVLPADMLDYHGWRTDVKTQGIGAPIVARVEKKSLEKRHDERLPYRPPPSGYTYPVTAVIDFSGSHAHIRLLDPLTTSSLTFRGKQRPLAKNLTAALAVSLQADTDIQREGSLTLLGVFEPIRFSDKMGIYSLSPLDPSRIPVILVHGLNSDPATWKNVLNELHADPTLRKKYQFLAFYYPTGLPLRVSSAELKRQINGIHQYYIKKGQRQIASRMVIIGHSLGGVLTSSQVRKIEPGLWKKAFKDQVKTSLINQEALRDYNYMIKGPKPHFVKRAVFIATPHRGSRKADIYIVRLLSSVVSIPERMLVLRVPEAAAALTDFGRAIFGAENPSNSLTILRSKSAQLKLISDSPIYPHIKYHSIVGDRGKGDTPNSSDGVVDYSSSHLPGAQSELIVPAGHSAHDHPNAIKELRRILLLHLGKK